MLFTVKNTWASITNMEEYFFRIKKRFISITETGMSTSERDSWLSVSGKHMESHSKVSQTLYLISAEQLSFAPIFCFAKCWSARVPGPAESSESRKVVFAAVAPPGCPGAEFDTLLWPASPNVKAEAPKPKKRNQIVDQSKVHIVAGLTRIFSLRTRLIVFAQFWRSFTFLGLEKRHLTRMSKWEINFKIPGRKK